MGRRGLRGRLDRLEANAHATMGAARSEMAEAVDLLRGFLEELEDGITIQLTIAGRKLPVEIRLVPDEAAAGG